VVGQAAKGWVWLKAGTLIAGNCCASLDKSALTLAEGDSKGD